MKLAKTVQTRRRFLGTASAASLGAAFIACGGGGDDASPIGDPSVTGSQAPRTPKSGGIIHVPTNTEPPNLDGTTQYTVSIHSNMAQVYNRVVRWNWGPGILPTSTEIAPELGASWEQPDDTTIVFHLQPNVRFQNVAPVNGRAFSSADIKATFGRILDPALHSQLAGKWTGYLESVDTPDPSTATFKLSKPYAEFFNALAFHYSWIVPEELAAGDALKTQMIGTGPFMLNEYKKGDRITFKKNPDYWEPGKPYVDGLERILITDPGAMISSFSAGQLDLTDPNAGALDPDTIASLKSKVSGSRSEEDYPWATRRLQVTATKPPLNDPRVRLAILKLIDQKQIIDVAYQNGAFVGPLPWMFGDFGLPEAEAKKLMTVSVSEAKKLLDAAAYDYDQTLEISITPQYGAQYKSTAELVQQQLQKAGIKTKIESYQYAEYLARWKPPFDKNQLAVAPLTGNSPDLMFTAYNPKGDYYFAPVTDEKLIAMTEKQRTLIKPEERAAFTQDIQRYLLQENVVDIPLGLPRTDGIVGPSLQEFYYTNTFGLPSLRDAWLA